MAVKVWALEEKKSITFFLLFVLMLLLLGSNATDTVLCAWKSNQQSK